MSQTLLISRWRHDDVTPAGLAPGIDLDFVVSDGTGPECTDDVDFRSPLRGTGGIDNQYAAYLVGALDAVVGHGGVNAAVAQELARGLSLQGLEVRIVETDAGPSGISVEWVTLAQTEPLRVDSTTGALAADQTLEVVSRRPVEVACRDGELELRLSTLDLPLGEVFGSRPIDNVHVRFLVDDDGAVRRGDLGGAVSVATVLAVGIIAAGPRIDEATIRSVAHPDLDIDSDFVCQRVSLGVGLDVVPVELVEAL